MEKYLRNILPVSGVNCSISIVYDEFYVLIMLFVHVLMSCLIYPAIGAVTFLITRKIKYKHKNFP